MTIKRKLTIGLVSSYAMITDGGIQNHIFNLKRFLKKEGHTVYLFAPRLNDEQPLDSYTFHFGKAVIFYGEGTSLAVGIWPENGKRVKKILSSISFDVLHFHSPSISPTAWQIGYHSSCPIVATFHEARESFSPLYHLLRLPASFLGAKINRAIAVSSSCAKTIKPILDVNFTIIPNGIDTSLFSPEGETMPWFDEQKFTILYLGRLEERKGIFQLLSAFAKVKKTLTPARLVIAGQGILEEKIRQRIEKYRLADVYLTGFIAEKDKAKVLRSCHVFCAPAQFGESFGIILLEAMASGRPIIACSNQGYRELLSKEKAALLVPPKDIKALASSIVTLYRNEKKRLMMAETAVRKVKKYDWQRLTPRIVAVYHQAIKDYQQRKKQPEKNNFSLDFIWQNLITEFGKRIDFSSSGKH